MHDLTANPSYATLVGYTVELQEFLSDRIKQVAEDRSATKTTTTTEAALLAEMKEWYNGYRFAWGEEPVYDPYSALSFLQTGRV